MATTNKQILEAIQAELPSLVETSKNILAEIQALRSSAAGRPNRPMPLTITRNEDEDLDCLIQRGYQLAWAKGAKRIRIVLAKDLIPLARELAKDQYYSLTPDERVYCQLVFAD